MDGVADGIVNMFALKHKWMVLGDHLYSHRLVALKRSTMFLWSKSNRTVVCMRFFAVSIIENTEERCIRVFFF